MELLNKIFNHPGLRRILVKSRIFIGIAFIVLIIIYGRLEHYFLAFSISLFGELIQIWSSSSLEKNQVLTARGPYSLVRNPMYLGRFLVILGGIILLNSIYVILLYVVIYYFYMINRVKREEAVLGSVFGRDYESYCTKVHRFLPSKKLYRWSSLKYFNWQLLRENHGHWNFLAMIFCYVLFYLSTLFRSGA